MKTSTFLMTLLASVTIGLAQPPVDFPPSSVVHTATIQHITVASRRDFAATIHEFEKQLGRFDPEVVKPLGQPDPQIEQIKAKLEAMAGNSGFMRFGSVQQFGDLLAVVGERTRKASQYVIGHPLIAVQMVRHKMGAGLYVPLRILIAEDAAGVTHLEYDLPSSLLEQFDDPEVNKVAHMLDQKLKALISSSANL